MNPISAVKEDNLFRSDRCYILPIRNTYLKTYLNIVVSKLKYSESQSWWLKICLYTTKYL